METVDKSLVSFYASLKSHFIILEHFSLVLYYYVSIKNHPIQLPSLFSL